jgi:hypothetical protein
MHNGKVVYMTLVVLLIGCTGNAIVTVPSTDAAQIATESESQIGGYIPWGFWDLEIGRDGSYADIMPVRSAADVRWGYHMNVVKLLEVSPCTNCLNIGNIHLLPNGDVSVDISLRHPYMDARYTGFDVRGIIMFPASQYYPDNDIRELMGLPPYDDWKLRIANHEFGDAELMNPDGWTNAWASEEGPGSFDYFWYQGYAPDKDLPIFQYFPGKFSSGENLSTLSAYKRYHSTEVRHMFEVGHAVTHTYIIRPPTTGPIEASYAVYAHWYPADNVPVIDPAVDFPPEANSPLPYEFFITQDSPLDFDNPDEKKESEKIHWHIKTWSIDNEYWAGSTRDYGFDGGTGGPVTPHPSGEPDDYEASAVYFGSYPDIPDAFPGTWPWLFSLGVKNPKDTYPNTYVGFELYIAQLEYAAWDGVW